MTKKLTVSTFKPITTFNNELLNPSSTKRVQDAILDNLSAGKSIDTLTRRELHILEITVDDIMTLLSLGKEDDYFTACVWLTELIWSDNAKKFGKCSEETIFNELKNREIL